MTRSVAWRYRRRVIRTPPPVPRGGVQLVVSQHDALILPQSFLIMSGDTIRINLTAVVEGTKPEDFRRITLPVTIQANIA